MSPEPRPLPLAGARLPERPIVFERVAVVGLGLIGGSVALAARQVWPACLVIGVDRNEVLEDAVARHAVDVAASDLTIISEADLVVLAAPVLDNMRLLAELPHYIDRSAVVTDVGSTKRSTVDASRSLPARLAFVGGHPLAGSTRRGLAGARVDLFAGRPWLLTPTDSQDAQVGAPQSAQIADLQESLKARNEEGPNAPLERLLAFVEGLGAVPRVLDPDEHDRLVAFISHLPQLTASALMQVVGDAVGQGGLSLSGRGLQDTTRLAGSPADIWTDICRTNADQIGPAIDTLIETLHQLRGAIEQGGAIGEVFEAANRWRSLLVDAAKQG